MDITTTTTLTAHTITRNLIRLSSKPSHIFIRSIQTKPTKINITPAFRATIQSLSKTPLSWVMGSDYTQFIFRLPQDPSKVNQGEQEKAQGKGFDFVSLDLHPKGINEELKKKLGDNLECDQSLSKDDKSQLLYTLTKYEHIPQETTDISKRQYKPTPLYPTTNHPSFLVSQFTKQFTETNPITTANNEQHYTQSTWRHSEPLPIQIQLFQSLLQQTLGKAQVSGQTDFGAEVNLVKHLFTPEPVNRGLFDDLILSLSVNPERTGDVIKRWAALVGNVEAILKEKGISEGVRFDSEVEYWEQLANGDGSLGEIEIEV